jgi:predicted metal-dependent phosphoesterase TrpH
MAIEQRPLLCELHAHTTWSDGALSVREVCDLYGRHGFDVLAITDHTAPHDHVQEASFRPYLAEVEAEAERARRLYDLLVLPGLELTHEAPQPEAAAHAVAIGLRTFVGVDAGLEESLRAARAHGAALVAAHPYSVDDARHAVRSTAAFAADPERWAPLVDRFELFNRVTIFAWVAEAGLPAVATGDFHVPSHLATWKTMLPCAKDEGSVVAYLRSARPAYLVRALAAPQPLALAAASPNEPGAVWSSERLERRPAVGAADGQAGDDLRARAAARLDRQPAAGRARSGRAGRARG